MHYLCCFCICHPLIFIGKSVIMLSISIFILWLQCGLFLDICLSWTYLVLFVHIFVSVFVCSLAIYTWQMESFTIWNPKQCWSIAWHYKETGLVLNGFIDCGMHELLYVFNAIFVHWLIKIHNLCLDIVFWTFWWTLSSSHYWYLSYIYIIQFFDYFLFSA